MFEIGFIKCIGGPSSVLYSQVSVCSKERPTKKINCGEKPGKSERWLWNLVSFKNQSDFWSHACQMPFATSSDFAILSSHFIALFFHLYFIKDSLVCWDTKNPQAARESIQTVSPQGCWEFEVNKQERHFLELLQVLVHWGGSFAHIRWNIFQNWVFYCCFLKRQLELLVAHKEHN